MKGKDSGKQERSNGKITETASKVFSEGLSFSGIVLI